MTAPLTLAELVARTRAPGPIVPAPPPTPLSTAPELASIGPGAVAAYATGGAELITGREIAAVAGKLGRSKSDDKQTVGRAMLKALRGEVWAGDGHRNSTMYQIAGELVEAYPNLDPGSVVLAFSAAISNAQLNGSKYTEEKLESALVRLQEQRGDRIREVSRFGALIRDPQQIIPVWESPADTRAADLNKAGSKTITIRANGDYYLRTPDRGTYDWKLTSPGDLQLKLSDIFGIANATLITHQDEVFVGAPQFLEAYGCMADGVAHDYSSPSTTFDVTTRVLSVGLPAVLPIPVQDGRVAAWLLELAGGTENDLTELYDWVASTTREYIHRPAAALVIAGARDAGKSLFAKALAGTWGVLPVKLANAVERFNGALLGSPFWHADERMPEDMTEACFRETVPERERLIEPKGREKVLLRGCGRLMFTLNSVDDLHVGTAKGADAVDAVAGRIALFDCSGRKTGLARTHDALRVPGRWDLDLPAIVGHLRYVQTTVTPREQRFLGARLDGSAARAVVINQSARGAGDFVDIIAEYLDDPESWERDYKPNGSFQIPGRAYPLVTKDGKLYVWGSELAGRLAMRNYHRQLDALLLPGRVRIRFGQFQASYREVDLDRVVSLRPDVYASAVATCAVDTRDRSLK